MDETTVFSPDGQAPQQPIEPSQMQPTSPPPGNYSPPPPPFDEGGSLLSKGNIIKVGIGLIVLLLLIFAVSAVASMFKGGGSKQEKVTLVYWGLWEDKNVMQPILDDFHKKYPNITVKYEERDIHQYRDTLVSRIRDNGGSGAPDIFRFHSSWTPTISDILLPIPSSVIDPKDFQKNFYQGAVRDVTSKNGALLGVPLEMDTLSLFVNTDLLQAAGENVPTNWIEFDKVAQDITVSDAQTGKPKTAGAAIGTFSTIDHAPDIIGMLMLQKGVDMTNPANSSPGIQEVLQFYTQYASQAKDYNGTVTRKQVWDDTMGNAQQAFGAGRVGMYFGYSWDALTLLTKYPSLHFQVYQVPHLTPDRNMTQASYWVEGVASTTPHSTEALEFLQYLSQKDTEQKLATEESKSRKLPEPYARKDLASSIQSNKFLYPFVAQGDVATSTYFTANTYDDGLDDKANKYLGDAINSITIQGNSPDQQMDTLNQGLSQVLGQYVK